MGRTTERGEGEGEEEISQNCLPRLSAAAARRTPPRRCCGRERRGGGRSATHLCTPTPPPPGREGGRRDGRVEAVRGAVRSFVRFLLPRSPSSPPLCKNLPRCSCRRARHGADGRGRTMCVSSWRRRRSSSRAALCPPPDGPRTRPVRPPARPTQACKILDRRGGRRRLRPRLLACRSVFAELARCCSLSSLQRVRRKSLFLSHPFLALLTHCDAIHYLSESYHSLGGPLRMRGSLDPSQKIPRLSPISRRGGNGNGRTLYSTLLHIAALGGYESTVFAKRSPRAEFSVSHRRRRCHCSCTFARTTPLTTESERGATAVDDGLTERASVVIFISAYFCLR